MTLLTSEQLTTFKSILKTLSDNQLIWISGYLNGLIDSRVSTQNINVALQSKDQSCQPTEKIVILSASQTGNARQIAEQLYSDFINVGSNVVLFRAGEYKFKKISDIKLLIFIISTYGEGEPPEEAIALYKYLFSKNANRMENTNFAIFSLGDRSYEHFAKAGKDLDNRFAELGANRLHERVDVDIDFNNAADIWRKKIVSLFTSKASIIYKPNQNNNSQKSIIINNRSPVYSRKSPLIAHLSHRQKITSRNSIKDIHHLEIDITGSNLHYQPGDSLGIWYENDPSLVNELLELLDITDHKLVEIQGQSMSIHNALKMHYELTQNTPMVVKNIAAISQNKLLLDLLNNEKKLHTFIKSTPIIDMIRQISIKLTPWDLLKVLRPMQPRFYSISSAQSEVGEEIHITVNVLRYTIHGRLRSGGASSYLVDRLQENGKIRIFIEPNNNFKLPQNPNIPIIMIGAGTGIAPFRSFIQQRASDKAAGKNWLFFGNLKFIDDFLYQTEWQNYTKIGLLSKINTAWSRDQDHKIYVQDQLLKNGLELWSWIQEGAYIYICGDAKHMARDVEQALITLTSKHGDMNLEQSHNFWNKMRIQHRYQRDIY